MLFLVAGCGELFGLDEVKLPDAAPPCLTDQFEGTTEDLATNWTSFADNDGCRTQLALGELEQTIDPNAVCHTGVLLKGVRSLVGARVTVKVPAVVPNGTIETIVNVEIDRQNYYRIGYIMTVLKMFVVSSGAGREQELMLPYDYRTHQYWQIEHRPADATNPSTVVFSTSSAGTDWVVRHTVTEVLPVDAMTVELASRSYATGATTQGTSRFDDFNLCMP